MGYRKINPFKIKLNNSVYHQKVLYILKGEVACACIV